MQYIVIDNKIGKKWILTDHENEYGTIQVEYFEYSFICEEYSYIGIDNYSKDVVKEIFGIIF